MKKLKLLLCTIALGLVPWLGMAADAPPPAVAETAAAVTNAVAAVAEAPAAPAADPAATLKIGMDTMWVLLCGALVFWMNAGFACVESGMCQQKNTANILAKNFVVFACASLSYYFIGWGLMFGDGSDWVGTEGIFMLKGEDNSPATGDAYKGVYSSINWTGVPLYAKFFFQLVFAGTAATIVSGAVAERIKFGSFVLFSFVLVAFMYPVTGHWIWGGGFLADMGFYDFAGSTVVHSMGGWAALAGVIVLGPRAGKYLANGKVHPFPGHSLALSTIGVFILWLGWFGFNPGSTMGVGDGSAMAHVFVTTNTAAVAGIISAMITAWLLLGKPDLSMILNGCLAGLVAITAPCAFVSVGASIVIGLIAGVLVVLSVLFFDKMKIDDPVGALSVHLANGVWGTLALGLFADAKISKAVSGFEVTGGMSQLMIQLKGVLAVAAFTFIISFIVWYVLKATIGIRVTAEEEQEGLDIGEHGNEAYPDFVINNK
ncbi:MAG: ammonium transporter [Verrucomicrobia bacterium]|jgi:Amt family ammonium transporter|nr:ammonium transporter [Verrucomicrobiota bacterium]